MDRFIFSFFWWLDIIATVPFQTSFSYLARPLTRPRQTSASPSSPLCAGQREQSGRGKERRGCGEGNRSGSSRSGATPETVGGRETVAGQS
eukprot:612806-Rhodomonas_salina.3